MRSLLDSLASIVGEQNLTVGSTLEEYRKSIAIVNPDTVLSETSIPQAVVRPSDTREVVEIVKLANKRNVPIYVQSGGTDTTGGSMPIKGGVMVDLRRMDDILKISSDGMYAVVQGACPLMRLESVLEKKNLRLGHMPTSIMLGVTAAGAVSTYGAGSEASGYDSIGDHVIGMEVVTPTGKVLRIRPLYKSSMLEKNLLWLFIGTQGQHGIITEVTLGVQPFRREMRRMRVFNFPTFVGAVKCSYEIHHRRIRPSMLFTMNRDRSVMVIPKVSKYPDAKWLLLLAFDDVEGEIGREVDDYVKRLCEEMGGKDLGPEIAEDAAENMYKTGKKVSGLFTKNFLSAGPSFPDMETGLKWCKKAMKICESYGVTATVTHWGPGNGTIAIIHGYPDDRGKEGQLRNTKCRYAILSLALEMGGTADSSNGVGLRNSYFLVRELGETGAGLMRRIKSVLDPNNVLNPGLQWGYWDGEQSAPVKENAPRKSQGATH